MGEMITFHELRAQDRREVPFTAEDFVSEGGPLDAIVPEIPHILMDPLEAEKAQEALDTASLYEKTCYGGKRGGLTSYEIGNLQAARNRFKWATDVELQDVQERALQKELSRPIR